MRDNANQPARHGGWHLKACTFSAGCTDVIFRSEMKTKWTVVQEFSLSLRLICDFGKTSVNATKEMCFCSSNPGVNHLSRIELLPLYREDYAAKPWGMSETELDIRLTRTTPPRFCSSYIRLCCPFEHSYAKPVTPRLRHKRRCASLRARMSAIRLPPSGGRLRRLPTLPEQIFGAPL